MKPKIRTLLSTGFFTVVFAFLSTALPAFADNMVLSVSPGTEQITDGSFIWFGKGSDNEKWRVLGNANDGGSDSKLLISEYVLDSAAYEDNGNIGYEWQNSPVQKWCSNYYSFRFTEIEKTALRSVSKEDGAYSSNGCNYAASSLNNEKVFFLSAEEAATYFSGNNDRRATDRNGAACWWLLRTPRSSFSAAGTVAADGTLGSSTKIDGTRPAFNLALGSVIMVSAAENGKPNTNGQLSSVASGSFSELKLTLSDSNRSQFSVTANSLKAAPGGEITIPYTGAQTGTNEYISVLLCSTGGQPLYYGSVGVSSQNKAKFTLPNDLTTGEDYVLRVFNEQKNGDKYSDYSSGFRDVTLAVRKPISYTVTFKVANGRWSDDDGGSTPKTVTLKGFEGDSLRLGLRQIPEVGDDPGNEYRPAGGWSPAEPDTETVITKNITYTYTYLPKIVPTVTAPVPRDLENTGKEQELVDPGSTDGGILKYALGNDASQAPAQEWDTAVPKGKDTGTYFVWYMVFSDDNYTYSEPACVSVTIRPRAVSRSVTFRVVNGQWDNGTSGDKTVTLEGYEGDTLRLAEDDIPAVGNRPDASCKAGSWDTVPDTETAITSSRVYIYTYAQKERISQTVTFRVVNGQWDDGTSGDKTVTLEGYEGDTLRLAEDDIPAVGNKPDASCKAGSWDTVPETETGITEAVIYTYSFVYDDTVLVLQGNEDINCYIHMPGNGILAQDREVWQDTMIINLWLQNVRYFINNYPNTDPVWSIEQISGQALNIRTWQQAWTPDARYFRGELTAIPEEEGESVFTVTCTWGGQTAVKTITVHCIDISWPTGLVNIEDTVHTFVGARLTFEPEIAPAGWQVPGCPQLRWGFDDEADEFADVIPAKKDESSDPYEDINDRKELYIRKSGTFQSTYVISSDRISVGRTVTFVIDEYPKWTVVLPTGVGTIEEDTFRGVPAEAVYIPPDGSCKKIRAGAFADSGATAIFIPASVTEIEDNALPENVYIFTPKNSYAATWAAAHGFEEYQIIEKDR